MERLSFTSRFAYNANEAAIHMARYQLAAPFCKGRRVLDIACGEGYGSVALKRFGASSVEAVDNSPEAIATARKLFSAKGVKHHVADASKVGDLFGAGEFDLIVSLETIEHLQDPEQFLQGLKKVAKKDAVIIVSCPNDTWYYPESDQGNPFHVRKFTFEEFRELTSKILGPGAVWGYGVPMVGFGNVTDDEVAGRDQMLGQSMMLDFTAQASAITLPQRQNANVGPRNCSYFVGLWGGQASGLHSAAMVPISMDQYSNIVSWENANVSPNRIAELEAEKLQVAAATGQFEAQIAAAAVQAEHARIEQARVGRELAIHLEEKSSLEVRLAELANQIRHEQSRVATLEHDLESAKSGRLTLMQQLAELQSAHDVKQHDAQSYRVQAFAVTKEVDLIASQVQHLREVVIEKEAAIEAASKSYAALESIRDGLAAQQVEAEVSLVRLQEVHAVQQKQAEAAFADLQAELAASQKGSDGHRLQAFALAKEVALLTTNAQSLSGRLAEWKATRQAEIEATAAATAATSAAAEQVIEPPAPIFDAAADELRANLENVQLEADRYRVQAFALSKEVEILSGRVAELSVERNRALSVPGSAVGDLLREKEALERRVNALLLVAGNGTGGLKAQIIRSGKYRLRRAGIAVRPMLPSPVLSVAMRVARKLNL